MKSARLAGYALFMVLLPLMESSVGETRIFDSRMVSDLEPSGAVWHPRLNTLLVVSDTGLLLSMSPDGGLPNPLPFAQMDGSIYAYCRQTDESTCMHCKNI